MGMWRNMEGGRYGDEMLRGGMKFCVCVCACTGSGELGGPVEDGMELKGRSDGWWMCRSGNLQTLR